MSSHKASELELDLLFLYYAFSDQYGNVNATAVTTFLAQRFGLAVLLPKSPQKFTQENLNILIENGVVPDVMPMLTQIFSKPLPEKKKRRKKT